MLSYILKRTTPRVFSTSIREISKFTKGDENAASATNHKDDINTNIEDSVFNNSALKYDATPIGKVFATLKIQQKQAQKLRNQRRNQRNQFKESITSNSFDNESSATVKDKVKVPAPQKLKASKTEPKLIFDERLGIKFYRLRLRDPILNDFMLAARSSKRNDANRLIVIEGRRLISDAIKCKLRLQRLVFSQEDQLEYIKDDVADAQQHWNSKIYKIAQHDLKTWSTLTTPPGLLGVFEKPQTSLPHPNSLPITVVCDNIREPNNLGSIIRTCAALPCQKVLITRGCCDPWDTKALRGGCSGQFRIPIEDTIDWDSLIDKIPQNCLHDCHVFIAENNLKKMENDQITNVMNYSDVQQLGMHNIVIIGGESHGVSQEAYSFLNTFNKVQSKCVYIPVVDGIDSLNVVSALTLILYELKNKLQLSRETLLV